MSDIAHEAGCSQSTVSFVLNDNKSVQISVAMRDRVLQSAKELGYHDQMFRGLLEATKQKQISHGAVGFVIDFLSTSPEGIVAIEGVHQALRETGDILLIAEIGSDPEREVGTIRHLLDHGVKAIIYCCIFTRKVVLPELLKTAGIPTFLLNCYSKDMIFPAVVPGEIVGGQVATTTLIEAGHRRIGTITGETFMAASKDRLIGYRRALSSADIPFDPDLVINGDWSASAGYRATAQLMSLANPPTAIFCQNDRMAIGSYEQMKELNLLIPQDVSIIGYDDEDIGRHLSPPLSTLVLPQRAMGRWTVEQIHFGNHTPNTKTLPVKLECALIKRDSIAVPRQKVDFK